MIALTNDAREGWEKDRERREIIELEQCELVLDLSGTSEKEVVRAPLLLVAAHCGLRFGFRHTVTEWRRYF
jgi:hypothetical protein